ncbi:UNVERIFIED_CONTAM: Retrovirus-related Pol polyprotein from transposon TNT 1-94 [Sesamum radiatum]|uniref:Retrovirus-related Pol polyprotein from transposon TNT 1-94 n=1 Tax=Sesamum radiatum TaxID=300843 RepID=A0AAW2VZD4_SESRA
MASSSTTGTGSRNDSGDTRAPALDHHGMVMISAPLNGNNWLSWSRSVRIALEGREKLGYIDGTVSRTLWLDLEARYGECDGPLLYRVQREIGSMTQGNRTVTAYYTTLRQLWDELVCLKPPAMCKCGRCICGSNDAKKEEMEASQLIQFLTGLNESYDNIRSQILVLDPLPHVNKAYSMVLQIERQRQVNLEFNDHGENSALMGKGYDNRGSVGFKNNLRRKDLIDKRNLKCENCHKTGHSKDTCLRLHGVPDWYKELHDQRKKTLPGNRAYAVNDNTSVNVSAVIGGGDLVADLMEALRLVQTNKQPLDPVRVHFAQGDEMAGHAGVSALSHIPMLTSITDNKHDICTICPLAKQSREPFSLSESHTYTPFELIHVDIWGPYKQPSLSGCHYVLTIVDDYTRVTWTYLMQHKSQTVSILSSFLAKTATQFDAKVKTLRSDNAHSSLPSSSEPSPPIVSEPSVPSEPRPPRQRKPLLGLKTFTVILLLIILAKGKLEWENAMKEELAALDKNNTWEVVDLPKGKRAIGSKWVFKLKLRPDGSVDRYKARLVA